MIFLKNQLFEFLADVPSDEKKPNPIIRLLYAEPTGENVVVIDIKAERAFPERRFKKELEASISNALVRRLDYDEHAKNAFLDEQGIDPEYRDLRDKRYAIIKPIIESGDGLDIYCAELWGELVTGIHNSTGKAKTTVYRLIRRWLQRGQHLNTLLPDWHQSGGRGQEKTAGEAKRGRPVTSSDGTVGVNITPESQKLIERGMKEFWKGDITFEAARQKTLLKYFNMGYRDENGIEVPVMPEGERVLPTIDQFRYCLNKNRNPETESKRRKGKRYPLENRPLLGDTRQNVTLSGQQIEVDAHICPIYLVHPLFPNMVIGKPVLYAGVDTFSSAIPAVAAMLENPSWSGMALLISSFATNMVELAALYGITTQENEWLERALPVSILGDNGELQGTRVEDMLRIHRVDILNAPPFRPDLKPTVESAFRQFDEEFIFKRKLPGRIRNKDFGDSDYRLEAVLTPSDFTKIVLEWVLWRNNAWKMQKYPLTTEMISDGINLKPTPMEVWKWGLKGGAHLKSVDPYELNLSLLPRDKATFSAHGLYYRGLFFVSDAGIQQGWYVRDPRKQQSDTVEIKYNPVLVNTIYIINDDSRESIPCYLSTRTGMKKFIGMSWDEVDQYFKAERSATMTADNARIQGEAQVDARIQRIVDERGSSEVTQHDLKNIRDNRNDARSVERGKDTLSPIKPVSEKTASETHQIEQPVRGSQARPNLASRIRAAISDPDEDSNEKSEASNEIEI